MKTQIIHRLGLLLRYFLIALGIALMGGCILLLAVSYNDLLEGIIQRLDLYSKADKVKTFLPPARITALKVFLCFFLILYGVLLSRVWYKTGCFIEKIIGSVKIAGKYLHEMGKAWRQLSTVQKVVASCILAGIALQYIYYLHIYPFTYDEVFSYLLFVDKGFLVSATYYPGPNNHIFYSLVCCFADLFMDDPVWAMRLPALVAGILTMLLVFFYFLKKYSFEAALTATVTLAAFYNVFYYAFHGRGYAFLLFFFVLALLALQQLLEKQENKEYFEMIYTVSSILGFYTIPVFLYPFVSMQAVLFLFFVFRRDGNTGSILIRTSVAVSLAVIFLYMPVILLSGLSSLVGNSWVRAYSGTGLSAYIHEVLIYLWNGGRYDTWISLLLVTGACLICWKRKQVAWISIFISCFTIPVIMIQVQQVHPFGRVWNYLLFLFAAGIGMFADALLRPIPYRHLRLAGCLAICVLLAGWARSQIKEVTDTRFPYYTALNRFMEDISRKRYYTIYAPEENYDLFLQYQARQQHKAVNRVLLNKFLLPDLVVLPQKASVPIDTATYFLYQDNGYVRAYLKK